MRKIYTLFLCAILCAIVTGVNAQNNFFRKADPAALSRTKGVRAIIPSKYEAASVDIFAMRNFLWSLPEEKSVNANRAAAPVITLPMPDGSTARFHVWESSIQAPALAAKFPEIKTFAGQGIDDPAATIRFDYSPYFGFRAQILSPNGRIYIDPYAKGETDNVITYYQRDNLRGRSFKCGTEDIPVPENTANRVMAGPCRGTELKTYRLAVACTAEYAAAVGGGLAGPTHAAIVTSTNRVNGVYETELAVRLVLIANNDQIEYLTNPDPYNNVISSTELNNNQNNLNAVIGVGAYDIGHLFTSDDNGLAAVASVCNASNKARGATGSPSLIGDGFDIDYVAHEIGHQFGAGHSYNSNQCASPGGSYEVGGGTTIMAYAGICAAGENIQPNSDPIFHAISFDQISNFLASGGGTTCGIPTATGNTLPVITSMSANNLSIPINTPFTLNATATDANGDALTYNWEGWDIGVAGSPWTSAATSTTRPLFRTRVSKTTGSRTFPDPRVIAANYPNNAAPSAMDGLRGEILPQVARAMKFRVTVRDNRAAGGGVVSGGDGCQNTTVFTVNAVGSTPFTVTSPNGGESYPGGSTQTVTWNVANTNTAPISVTNVKISLSTDGGLTFPTVLLASTANDGSEAVTFPSITSTTARVKVEAIDNIFFDISNANFTLTTPVTGFDFGAATPATLSCPAPASTAFTFTTSGVSGFSTPINLTATNVPAGASVTYAANPVTPGTSVTATVSGLASLAAGTYTITITGTAGSVVRTRDLQITINPGAAPTITTQPSAVTSCAGSNVSFTVAATGATGYQWQVSTDGGTNYTNISGATTATLSLNAIAATLNNNRYRVVVAGQCGSAVSNAAQLTVQTAPAISAQPQSATLCLGSNATFSVTASGTGLSYQWQLSTDAGANFSNISGATNASLTVNSITTAMNNNRYRVIVSGTCPSPATSSAATLTVVSPPTVATSPASTAICATGNVTFTASSTSPGVLYQWQVSTDGGANYSSIAGATTATLQLNSVTTDMNNNRYRVALTNATCTAPVFSTAAVLTVNARPTVDLTATPFTNLLPGQQTTLNANIVPSAAGFNITWYFNGNVLPGVTGTSFLVDSVKVGDYKVAIVNTTTGCNNESAVLSIGATSSSRLFIYPSPNNGRFTVSYFNSNGQNTSRLITVFDSKGAKVYQRQFTITGPYQLLDVDIRPLMGGIYHVVVGDASGKKLVEGKVLVVN